MRSKMNPYLYEHVNIREQCSWAHKHDPKGATAKAIQLISAAVGKITRSHPLEKIRLPNHRRALVVGGGPAGLKVAAELAGCGIPVLLVEQSDQLGGKLRKMDRLFPGNISAAELADKLESVVTGNPLVEVLLKSDITKISGFIGNFEVQLRGAFGPGGQSAEIHTTVGVIVAATGFRAYEPSEGEYEYRRHANVVTSVDFNQILMQQNPRNKTLIFQDRPVRSIAFIHCVGSRQVEGVHTPGPEGRLNTYCSRVCCTTVLHQALQVRNRFPGTRVYDLHQDIRTYGRGHEEFYTDASRAGVVFFRYHGDEPPTVLAPAKPEGALTIRVKDYLTWGEELDIKADMVVLAVGMRPGGCETLVDQLKLPRGEDGFLQEIHPKLRPVEISVNGVLLAGTAQAPMNIQETLAAAGAAAVKARAMFSKEDVELNPYVAEVDTHLCEGSGLCVAECQYDGALAMVETVVDGKPMRKATVNPGLCVGCGACVAVCPSRAINVSGWRIDQYDAMVEGLVREIAPAAGV